MRCLVFRHAVAALATLAFWSPLMESQAQQEPPESRPAPSDTSTQDSPKPVSPVGSDQPAPGSDRPKAPALVWPPEFEARLPKLEDIQPLPPSPIPDDPPPHEGAMIDIPSIIEPPDLLIVDVLEALPGRPITGQRLVRPDGTITLGFYGDVHVRGLTVAQAKTKIILHLRQFLSEEQLGLIGLDSNENTILIPPPKSDRVSVDIAAYNSQYYYVQGDIAAPGRLPITGQETVLDALNYAGSPLPTGNLKDIKLIRPARGGKPARVYPIDLEAIQQRGDVTTNLQLFPGDRIYVGRGPMAQAMVQLVRIAEPVQQFSLMAKYLHDYFRDADVPPERRREITRRILDLGLDAIQRKEGEPLDEAQLRALFEQMLELPPIEEAAPAPANEP